MRRLLNLVRFVKLRMGAVADEMKVVEAVEEFARQHPEVAERNRSVLDFIREVVVDELIATLADKVEFTGKPQRMGVCVAEQDNPEYSICVILDADQFHRIRRVEVDRYRYAPPLMENVAWLEKPDEDELYRALDELLYPGV